MIGSLARSRVAVVIAAIDARSTIRASLTRFLEEVDGRGEVVLVDASRDGTAALVEAEFPRVRLIRSEPGRLAPELWADGWRNSDAPLVALSNATMVPRAGWLDGLLERLDETGAAAVGGGIEPGEGLSPTDRAIYLLRYVSYLRPIPAGSTFEPPGENAIYRRDALGALENWLDRGFWESEIHRELRRRGERLELADGAVVEFHGGQSLASALKQRHRHAAIYGAGRSSRMNASERLMRTAAAPMVPAVLLRRIAFALRNRRQAIGPWLPALPRLALLLAAWASGEARGTWVAPQQHGSGA